MYGDGEFFNGVQMRETAGVTIGVTVRHPLFHADCLARHEYSISAL